MIAVLNGTFGIGKSKLAERLAERTEWSTWLDGDRLAAAHPPAGNERAGLDRGREKIAQPGIQLTGTPGTMRAGIARSSLAA